MPGPKEQPLPPDVIGREDATEVLRAFVLDGGLSIAFMRAFEEPDKWSLISRSTSSIVATKRPTISVSSSSVLTYAGARSV